MFLAGDVCQEDRCECSQQAFDCCLDVDANYSGVVLGNGSDEDVNCTLHDVSYIVGSDVVFQPVKVFPESFPYPVEIIWSLRLNGTVGGQWADENDTNPLGISVAESNGTALINGTINVNIEVAFNETAIDRDLLFMLWLPFNPLCMFVCGVRSITVCLMKGCMYV